MLEEQLEIVKKAIDEKKGERPLLFSFQALNPSVDYAVICSASSLRQVYAIADNIDERMREHGYAVRGIEGDRQSSWLLVDLGEIIVHVFQNEERAHYQLEKLYADLPRTDFSL